MRFRQLGRDCSHLGDGLYPMMVAIDFSGFRGTYKRPKKLVITVVVNAVVPMMAEEPVGAERLRALSQRRIEPRAA